MSRTALLLGASGLVGGHCLDLLLADQAYDHVLVFVRKKLPRQHAKLQQHLVDFERLQHHAHALNAREVFCCLGTTIKKAGSQTVFRKVDFEYPLAAAKLAAQHGAEQFLLITAMGANPKSAIFYNRVKGEVEEAVRSLTFSAVHIFRPSLLMGDRAEPRLGEKIGEVLTKTFSFLLVGRLRKYRAIEARVVATAMVKIAKLNRAGVHVYDSDRIQALAGDRQKEQ